MALNLPGDLTGVQNLSGLCSTMMNYAVMLIFPALLTIADITYADTCTPKGFALQRGAGKFWHNS